MSQYLNWMNEFYKTAFSSPIIPNAQTMGVLIFVAAMSALLFFTYRVVSHRALYNKSFNICVAVLPFFISTIILCLQSNIVITLGTIGALAIIRFRTAVKDPVDMVYLLWAVHLGIMAGCQLFMVFILTSVFVILLMLLLENIRVGRSAYTLIVNCKGHAEKELTALIKPFAGRLRIKSRNYSAAGIDYVIDLTVREPQKLTEALSGMADVDRFSLIEYDSEDIV